MNIPGLFPLGLAGLIALQSRGFSWVFSSTAILKQQFFGTQPSLWSNSHPHMTTGKTIALTIWTFVGKLMSLLFKMVPRFVIAFLLRSKRLLISWLLSPSAVTLEPKKLKFVTASTFLPSIYHEEMRLYAMILVFWMLSFKPAFSLSSFTLIKRIFNASSFSAIRVVWSTFLRFFYISPWNLDSSLWFWWKEYWSSLPFPSRMDHVLSELFTTTHPCWVALHGLAGSFTWYMKGDGYIYGKKLAYM